MDVYHRMVFWQWICTLCFVWENIVHTASETSRGNFTFTLSREPTNWTHANQSCVSLNMTLASPCTSHRQHQLVMWVMRENISDSILEVWIGGYIDDVTHTWRWSSGDVWDPEVDYFLADRHIHSVKTAMSMHIDPHDVSSSNSSLGNYSWEGNKNETGSFGLWQSTPHSSMLYYICEQHRQDNIVGEKDEKGLSKRTAWYTVVGALIVVLVVIIVVLLAVVCCVCTRHKQQQTATTQWTKTKHPERPYVSPYAVSSCLDDSHPPGRPVSEHNYHYIDPKDCRKQGFTDSVVSHVMTDNDMYG